MRRMFAVLAVLTVLHFFWAIVDDDSTREVLTELAVGYIGCAVVLPIYFWARRRRRHG